MPKGNSKQTSKGGPTSEDFEDVRRMVQQLGGYGIKGAKKMEWKREQVRKYGGLPDKKPNIPFKVREGMKKKNIERQARRTQVLQDVGLVDKKAKKPSSSSASKRSPSPSPAKNKGQTGPRNTRNVPSVSRTIQKGGGSSSRKSFSRGRRGGGGGGGQRT